MFGRPFNIEGLIMILGLIGLNIWPIYFLVRC